LDFELFQNAYRARALARFDWLEHGFGTRFFDPPEPLTTLRQVHSDIAVYADRDGCLGEGDAILSDSPGRFVGVKTADCLPILLVDERHRAVAAVHAGWRGTVAGVVRSTLKAMAARWDTQPGDLHTAIGPGIGPCCFEVGPDVAVQFGEPFQCTCIDLEQANRRQLIEAGLASDRIYTLGLCTFCLSDQFHSFRRDREKAGRMISVVGVKTLRARD
jgi:purine-nucleoside/S-methyl-5'-thioadenosine phosphorylase / adenosine deaminase